MAGSPFSRSVDLIEKLSNLCWQFIFGHSSDKCIELQTFDIYTIGKTTHLLVDQQAVWELIFGWKLQCPHCTVAQQCAFNKDGRCATESSDSTVISSVSLMTLLASDHFKCCCSALTDTNQNNNFKLAWNFKWLAGENNLDRGSRDFFLPEVDYMHLGHVLLRFNYMFDLNFRKHCISSFILCLCYFFCV